MSLWRDFLAQEGTVRNSLRWFLAAVSVVAIACQDETNPPVASDARVTIPESPDSVGFTDVIDLTVGVQQYRNVDVMGTLWFFVTPVIDSAQSEKRAGPIPYDVFIYTEMRFRRNQDYTMYQSWTAGGKSGDRLMLAAGSTVSLQKFYQIWSIPNEAYINITFLVTPSSVDVHALWVSYEPPPDS